MTTQIPEVTWAQRSSSTEPEKNYVYLTIVAADVPESDLKLDLKEESLSFKGTSTSKKVTYAVDLEFYAEIDPKESKIHHSGRDVTLVLRKKELKEEYWPRLLKDSKKMHFLKTNFDKWVDEDEQDEAPEDESMNQMNPMGGAGGDGGFGGIDFSKLGGAGGMGGMGGMAGMPGMGGMDLSSMGMDAADAAGEKSKIEELA
ncbi:CS domain-containing protein [Pyrenophora tritici-repentis]|uniref:CS multi-domain protein n=1 Tax=Pyrenophora tritici-repentis TaxID=45151 RepID=A0A5M9LHU8_9PLEO|nr:CS domain-containing protein [Pyrenophora tritici-repentis]KAF7576629.1 CS multi-domain protein [Pyrenophora tritici-repentis]PZD30622.1 cs domain-containing protein [Pyrenophora tritici-repentis]